MEPTLSAYNPTWRDRVASWMMGDSVASPERRAFVGGLLGSTGLGNNGVGVVDATPAGGLLGLQEAGQAGDRTGMALAAAGMLPGAGVAEKVAAKAAERAAPAAERFITAYHGSPHSFDKFSLDKIGTGEGAQAYGHGLYFADSEGVAKSYRDKLAMGEAKIGGRPVSELASESYSLPYGQQPTVEHRIADIISSYGDNARPVMEARYPELLSAYNDLKASGKIAEPGSMYQVRINADPEHFLDWDKPLSKQPGMLERVSSALPDDPVLNAWKENGALAHAPFASIYKGAAGATNADVATGKTADFSRRLNEAGIPGIKYLDQGSRSAGDGSRNYVVFDDNLIEIMKKYGLVGLLGGGAAYGAGQQQQQGAPVL